MKYLHTTLALLCACSLFAQVTTEPKDIDPESTLKIIVNLSQLDQSKDYVLNLLDSADAGASIYFYTFSPANHPAGHPLVNGSGERPWQNSNDTLKMTKEADRVYSYTLVPTEFYEVEPAVVYEKDIKFLVKTKNGGGFGTPDNKSDDLVILVDPPKVSLDPAFVFPTEARGDDVLSINYENDRETKPTMQNIGSNDAFFYAIATLNDSTEIEIEKFTRVSNNPKLQLNSVGPSTFRKYIVPNEFFQVPAGKTISKMKFIITRRSSFTGGDDRINYDLDVNLDCQ